MGAVLLLVAAIFSGCGYGIHLAGDQDAEAENTTPDQADAQIDVAEEYLDDSTLDERPDIVIDSIDADRVEVDTADNADALEEESLGACANPPNPFDLVSPGEGELGVSYPTASFRWNETSDPDIGDRIAGYTLMIDEDPSFSSAYVKDGLDSNEYTLSSDDEALICGITYYWKVGATDTCDRTTWSDVRSFATKPTIAWTQTYNGLANGDDSGNDIAVGDTGNLYVIGTEYISGDYDNNIWITKYDTDGGPFWTQTYSSDGHYSDDSGSGITVDNIGNVYATGTNDLADIWVGKYDADGAPLWTQIDTGPIDQNNYGHDLAVDNIGNSFVISTVDSNPGFGINFDIWIRKYNNGGTPIWLDSYDVGSLDQGFGIAVDNSSCVYATGYVSTIEEGWNIWIRKYNSSGVPNWTNTYNSPANGTDIGRAIAVDISGNAYITGSTYVAESGEGANIWIGKYNDSGTLIWDRTYNGVANDRDEGNGIATNNLGNIYVTGYETIIGEGRNIWITKYDTDGNPLCAQTYNGPANGDDQGNGIAVDNTGNVYVTGYETVPGEGSNIWVREYLDF